MFNDCTTLAEVIIYQLSYLLTYLLTPWSRVLLEKLTSKYYHTIKHI